MDSAQLLDYERALIVEEREVLPESLAAFIHAAWSQLEPDRPLTWNWHHEIICEYLHALADGQIKELIITVPPRCMKSLIVGVFFHAWLWSRKPSTQILTLAHSDELALRDAFKARTLMGKEWYRARWGGLWSFTSGQSEKGYYSNTRNGHRNAQGILGGLTGKGGDGIIMDDLHDASKALSDLERINTVQAYDTKVPTRLNDPSIGWQILIMQRLHERDIAGHLLEQGWTHLNLPMEYEGQLYVPIHPALKDPRKTTRIEDAEGNVIRRGELLDPVRYPLEAIEKKERSLGPYAAAGQFQQRPTPKGGGVLRSSWWKRWPTGTPLPHAIAVIQSYDTAYSERDFRLSETQQKVSSSACTTWGVFWDEENQHYAMMLTDAWKDYLLYPALRRRVIDDARRVQPDYIVIESRASGHGIIADLKQAGLKDHVNIIPYNPSAVDGDKAVRVALSSPILHRGQIYAPEGKSWAEMVINDCASFRPGDNRDLTDSCTQAWLMSSRLHLILDTDSRDDSKARLYGRITGHRKKTPKQRIQAAYA